MQPSMEEADPNSHLQVADVPSVFLWDNNNSLDPDYG
jgi:hypothetical protein